MLLLRQSEGEQRLSNQSESDDIDHVRNETTNMLQQKNHKRRRKTTTVQSRLLNATTINKQLFSTSTMYDKQNRRQDNLREILPNQSMQSSGHKVEFIHNQSIY